LIEGAYVQLQKLGHLLRVGGTSATTEMHAQIMQLVAQAAVKVLCHLLCHETGGHHVQKLTVVE